LVEDDAHKYFALSLCPFILLIVRLYGLPECKLIFLLPYSPDLNPIEQAFSSIKAFLCHHWQDFSLSVIDRTCHNITAEKAYGFFRASGYVV
jgi:hypothetical protein